MPLPQFNLYPAFNTVRLSHVEFLVKDIAASRAFYVDMLGLQVTDEDSDTVYLRALEERGHHCMVLKKSDTSAISYLALKVYSEDDLDKAKAYFDTKVALYLYKVNGQWVESEELSPTVRGYSLKNGAYVMIKDYTGDEPYALLEQHKKEYPADYSSRPKREIAKKDNTVKKDIALKANRDLASN